MTVKKVSWTQFKAFCVQRHVYPEHLDQTQYHYLLAVKAGFRLECEVQKTGTGGDRSADQADLEDNWIAPGKVNRNVGLEAVSQAEKNDKVLRCFWGHGVTDANGLLKLAIQIPADGRWVAYGDAEFEERQFLDSVAGLYVEDSSRLFAAAIGHGLYLAGLLGEDRALTDGEMQAFPTLVGTALELGRDATIDEIRALLQDRSWEPMPLYPIVGHYDERAIVDPNPAGQLGTWKPGLAMTFQYGVTEAQPVGGYAWVPGLCFFIIEMQKETAVAGKRGKVSVDWAETNPGEL